LDSTDDVKFLLGFSDDNNDIDADAENDDDDDDDDQGIPAESVVLENHRTPEIFIPPSKSDTAAVGSTPEKKNPSSSDAANLTKEGKPRKRDPVDPSRCIYSCDNCDKAFTTKFNLKRHINLHCNKSKEAGVPIQGPPSASMPSRKARERREAMAATFKPGDAVAGSAKKKPPRSSKPSKQKVPKPNSKRSKLEVQTVPVTTATAVTTTQSTPVTVIHSSAKPQLHLQQQQPQPQQQQQQPKPSFVIQKANLPPSSTITYQVSML